MIVNNKQAIVWLIKDNKLIKGRRMVSEINYKGTDIAVLSKQRDDSEHQELLIKDQDNEYWKMNFASVMFEEFINATLDPTIIQSRIYCDNVIQALSQVDMREFFTKRINRKQYFNLCELKYISKHYPEFYNQAMKCRNKFIEKNNNKVKMEVR